MNYRSLLVLAAPTIRGLFCRALLPSFLSTFPKAGQICTVTCGTTCALLYESRTKFVMYGVLVLDSDIIPREHTWPAYPLHGTVKTVSHTKCSPPIAIYLTNYCNTNVKMIPLTWNLLRAEVFAPGCYVGFTGNQRKNPSVRV